MGPVFNALRSDELLVGIGQVLRAAADSSGTLEDYERSQLLSAFSVSRLLAAEQIAAPDLLAWARAELAGALAGAADAPAVTARDRIDAAADGIEIGDALCGLLRDLPQGDPRRDAVRVVLGELADREVAALADLPGRP